jgi:hypothetical protein
MPNDEHFDDRLRQTAKRSLQARASDVNTATALAEHRARLDAARPATSRDRRLLSAAAAGIVVIAGIAAIAWPREDNDPGTVATETVVPAPASTGPTRVTTEPAATPATETTMAAPRDSTPTTSSLEVVDAPADQITLLMIGERRVEALASLDGFTATHSIETTRGSNRTPQLRVQEITALSDGRIWSEDEQGSWTSIDPASGLYRGAYAQGFGDLTYQALTDRTDFVLGGLILALKSGHDPTWPIDQLDDAGVVIENTTLDGRETWTVFARSESAEFDIQSETTWVVDVDTGLIVEYVFSKWEDGQDGQENRFRSTLTDLRPADELPDDFPRQFPEGADVDVEEQFDHSNGHRLVPLEQAVAEFSPGLVVPTGVSDDATVTLYDRSLDNPGSNYPAGYEEVRIITRRGFDFTTVTVTKFIPIDGATLTVGEVQCYDLDKDGRCDPFGVQDNVERGALSGRDLWVAGGAITISDVGRTIRITDSDVERARELAETFVDI